jgi:hypothetical protein
MTPKQISTTGPVSACDVCGRTLLSGERPHVFLAGSARRLVCELCTGRAAHEGWIREGAVRGPRERNRGGGGGRSLLGRLRTLRGVEAEPRGARRRAKEAPAQEEMPAAEELPQDAPDPAGGREPTSVEPVRPVSVAGHTHMKLTHALDAFNASENARRMAGVARSLGAPVVSVRVAQPGSSVVCITIAWELTWYRYESDTAADEPAVVQTAHGTELEELDARDRTPNAAADEQGRLVLV